MSRLSPQAILWFASLALAGSLATPCSSSQPSVVAAGSGDAAFTRLAQSVLEEHYTDHPSEATYLGIHRFDDKLDDFSATAAVRESEAIKKFRAALAGIDPATLTADNALDREQLILALDARILELDTIRMQEKDPDYYSSGITYAAYVIMERNYAPAATRLRSLIAREQRMPAALQEARKNLTQAVPIYTEIAIEQIDGNQAFFRNDVPPAFATVTDGALLAQFTQANAAVVAALGD